MLIRKINGKWIVAMAAQLRKHSRMDFPSPQRGRELAKLTFKITEAKKRGGTGPKPPVPTLTTTRALKLTVPHVL